MQHSRITLMLIAGLVLTMSAAASALPRQQQAEQVVTPPENPAPVIIVIDDNRDEDGGGDVNIRISPWTVVISADREGITWSCPTCTDGFEIILPASDRTPPIEFVPAGKNGGGPGDPVVGRLIDQNLHGFWLEDPKAKIMGTYSIRFRLRGNQTITIDPDHEIDPRG